MDSILSGPYLTALGQYGVVPAPDIGYATIEGAWVEKRALPPWNYMMTDINYEAWLCMTSGPIPTYNNTVVCVVMPPGSSPHDGSLIGQHDHSLQPDLYWVPTMWIGFNDRNTMSAAFSHELAETLTDPDGDGVQVKPTSVSDWNEIADVCENLPYQTLNGVTVMSYWSADDKLCIVPQPEPVEAWQIMCIHKKWGDDNPNEPITFVGGIHIPSDQRYWMEQTEVIQRIENRDEFFVIGADGNEAKVIVRTHFPAWAPQGTKYITTVADQSKEDNLLSLPDCGQPLEYWNS